MYETYVDDFSFFMAPFGSEPPKKGSRQWLGLFNETTNDISSTLTVAVEFDKFRNPNQDEPNTTNPQYPKSL